MQYDPDSAQASGRNIVFGFQQARAGELANQKAKQEMANWLAEQEALKQYGQGEEIAPGIQRPDDLRRLWARAPNVASALESNRFLPLITARAKQQEMTPEERDYWYPTSKPSATGVSMTGGGAAPQEVTDMPAGLGETRKLSLGPAGTTRTIERDPAAVATWRQKQSELKGKEQSDFEKQWTDVDAQINSTRDQLRTKARPEDEAHLKNRLAYLEKRRGVLEGKLGFETSTAASPAAPAVAPTAPEAPKVQARPAPTVVGGTDISQLPQAAREALTTEQAKSGIEEAKSERLQFQTEQSDARKLAKDYGALDLSLIRLEKLGTIPTEKDGFVVDVRAKQGLLTGPMWGATPSLSPQAREFDQITGELSFQNIPKGSGQLLNSEGERAMYEKTQISPKNDPITNYNAAQALRSRATNSKQYPLFMEDWVAQKKTRVGAERAWSEYVENNPNVVPDDATGIAQKNYARIPWHIAQKGEAAMDKYLDGKLKKGKLYPTPGGRMIYGGHGEFFTPDQWAKGSR